MSDEPRLVFNKFTLSANEICNKIWDMTNDEKADYLTKFLFSLMRGVDFEDELFQRVYEENKEYQKRRDNQRRKAVETTQKHRAKKAEPAKPATPPKPTPAKPAPPKPPKFNALEAVESFARSDEEQEVLTEFVKMRAEKKKPISRIAFNALAKKLGDLSVSDSIASVRKSIENDWQGVFPESLKPRTFEREKSGPEKFMERVLREDLEEKNRQLKLKNEVKCELERG